MGNKECVPSGAANSFRDWGKQRSIASHDSNSDMRKQVKKDLHEIEKVIQLVITMPITS